MAFSHTHMHTHKWPTSTPAYCLWARIYMYAPSIQHNPIQKFIMSGIGRAQETASAVSERGHDNTWGVSHHQANLEAVQSPFAITGDYVVLGDGFHRNAIPTRLSSGSATFVTMVQTGAGIAMQPWRHCCSCRSPWNQELFTSSCWNQSFPVRSIRIVSRVFKYAQPCLNKTKTLHMSAMAADTSKYLEEMSNSSCGSLETIASSVLLTCCIIFPLLNIASSIMQRSTLVMHLSRQRAVTHRAQQSQQVMDCVSHVRLPNVTHTMAICHPSHMPADFPPSSCQSNNRSSVLSSESNVSEIVWPPPPPKMLTGSLLLIYWQSDIFKSPSLYGCQGWHSPCQPG